MNESGSSSYPFHPRSPAPFLHPCELLTIFVVDGNKVLFKYPSMGKIAPSLASEDEEAGRPLPPHPIYYSEKYKDPDDAILSNCSGLSSPRNQINNLKDEDIVFLAKNLNNSKHYSAKIGNLYILTRLVRPTEPRVVVSDLKIRFGSQEPTIEFVSVGVILNCRRKELLSTLSAVMWFEERRNGYMSEQVATMHAFHDTSQASNSSSLKDASTSSTGTEDTSEEDERCLDLIRNSSLAAFLRTIFSQVEGSAEVQVTLNGWLQVSHCFPHRSVSCHEINCFALLDAVRNPDRYIKPYHSILMLTEDSAKLPLNILPNDCANDLYQFIRAVDSTQPIAQIAVEMNLTLDQVTTFVAHLLYWRRAKLIYPLDDKIILVPNVNVTRLAAHVGEFSTRFPGNSLVSEILDFEQPICLGDRFAAKSSARVEYMAMIEWMLKRDILCQVHTYLFLVPEVRNEFANDYRSLMFGMENECPQPPNAFGAENTDQPQLSAAENQIINTALNQISPDVSREIRRWGFESTVLALKLLFERIRKYMDGRFNMQEIAFAENISIYDIGTVLHMLPDLLLTTMYRDPNPLMQI